MGNGLAAAFGTVLRTHRRDRGLSQEAFAELADVSRTYVSKLERGLHHPSLDVVFVFSAVLGCEPSDLVRETQQVLDADRVGGKRAGST